MSTSDVSGGTVDGQRSDLFGYLEIDRGRARFFRIMTGALAAWYVGYVLVVAFVLPPSIYLLAYYAVSYRAGFVRRGLAGQILELVPQRYFLSVTCTLMWTSFAVYCVALGALAWYLLRRGHRAERRVLVALLVPVLPFATTFAIFGQRPELFAAAAFLTFALALSRLETVRSAGVLCLAFGAFLAILAFFHELIPLEFALGTVLAISVLGPANSASIRLRFMALALAPGLAATATIITAGRKDIGDQLCANVPHVMVRDVLKVPPDRVTDFFLGRYDSRSDFHDWVCNNVLPYFNADLPEAVHSVAKLGILSLGAGFIHGVVVCAGTLWAIGLFTGVRWKRFWSAIRGGPALVLLACTVWIPVFATGVDWVRWWAIIMINLAGVYLVYAANQPEIENPLSKRDIRAFVITFVVLAVIPFMAGPGYFIQVVKL